MFRKSKNALLCRAAIESVAKRHNIEIKELSVVPDHVHVVVQIPPAMSQSEAIRILKGGSSYKMFRLNPNFRLRYQRGSLWPRGNFKDSVGRLTHDIAEEYVRSQGIMHNKSAKSIDASKTRWFVIVRSAHRCIFKICYFLENDIHFNSIFPIPLRWRIFSMVSSFSFSGIFSNVTSMSE